MWKASISPGRCFWQKSCFVSLFSRLPSLQYVFSRARWMKSGLASFTGADLSHVFFFFKGSLFFWLRWCTEQVVWWGEWKQNPLFISIYFCQHGEGDQCVCLSHLLICFQCRSCLEATDLFQASSAFHMTGLTQIITVFIIHTESEEILNYRLDHSVWLKNRMQY